MEKSSGLLQATIYSILTNTWYGPINYMVPIYSETCRMQHYAFKYVYSIKSPDPLFCLFQHLCKE